MFGALILILDAEGLYTRKYYEVRPAGCSQAAKGALAWDPRGVAKAPEMLLEPQGPSEAVVLKTRCENV